MNSINKLHRLKQLSFWAIGSTLVLFDTPVFAQTAAVAPSSVSIIEAFQRVAPMFLVVFVVFHFFIIKPQSKKESDHAALLKDLKNGDTVVTAAGMIGKVSNITPESITVEVAPTVKIKFEPAAILKKEGVK